jgi:hypothetical protein
MRGRKTSRTTHLTTQEHRAPTATGHKFMLVLDTMRSMLRTILKITPTSQMRHEISADRQQMRSMTNYIKVQLNSNTDLFRTPIYTMIIIKTTCNSPSSSSLTRLNPFRTPNNTVFNRVVPRISPSSPINFTLKQMNMKKNHKLFK